MKRPSEKRALLCALTYSAGSITLGRGAMGIQYVTEHGQVGELIARLSGSCITLDRVFPRLHACSTLVRLSGAGCRGLLLDAGCLGQEEGLTLGHIPEGLVERDEDRRCYLRGAFLGAGSVSDPKKGYHLEIVCRHERFAQELCGLLADYGLPARYAQRKNAYVAYLKEGRNGGGVFDPDRRHEQYPGL